MREERNELRDVEIYCNKSRDNEKMRSRTMGEKDD